MRAEQVDVLYRHAKYPITFERRFKPWDQESYYVVRDCGQGVYVNEDYEGAVEAMWGLVAQYDKATSGSPNTVALIPNGYGDW